MKIGLNGDEVEMDDMVMAESLIRLWGLCNIPINCELQKTNRAFDTHLKCKCPKKDPNPLGKSTRCDSLCYENIHTYICENATDCSICIFSCVILLLQHLPSVFCLLSCHGRSSKSNSVSSAGGLPYFL